MQWLLFSHGELSHIESVARDVKDVAEMRITAAQLYDHVSCPRRVDLDAHGDASTRAELSAFVRMLWERGSIHESAVVKTLPEGTLLLAGLAGDDRERLTLEAMAAGVPLIHGGRIAADDLLGDPDLLIRRGRSYIAADIKSGRAEEGGEEEGDGRPKAHYAVQVALYTDVLERMGMSAGRVAEIWDVGGDHVSYELEVARGKADGSKLVGPLRRDTRRGPGDPSRSGIDTRRAGVPMRALPLAGGVRRRARSCRRSQSHPASRPCGARRHDRDSRHRR